MMAKAGIYSDYTIIIFGQHLKKSCPFSRFAPVLCRRTKSFITSRNHQRNKYNICRNKHMDVNMLKRTVDGL